MSELPQHLQDAQQAIYEWNKQQAFQEAIGKFYTFHGGLGYPTALRRVVKAEGYGNENKLMVQDWEIFADYKDGYQVGPIKKFVYDCFIQTEAPNLSHGKYNSSWKESEEKVWYQSFERLIGVEFLETGKMDWLKNTVSELTKQRDDANKLSRERREKLEKIEELTKDESSPENDKLIAKKLYEMFEEKK